MMTFKPDLNKIPETEELDKPPELERIIALEVAEIVNKKTRQKINNRTNQEVPDKESTQEDNVFEESQLNSEQKSTQTEPFTKSPASSLRRKSILIVNRIFLDTDPESHLENKKMDDQNSVGDCKASPLDVFRYPNIRKKFFILTFDWIALGVVYNSLSYNTPNLGVDDYLAFFIGKDLSNIW